MIVYEVTKRRREHSRYEQHDATTTSIIISITTSELLCQCADTKPPRLGLGWAWVRPGLGLDWVVPGRTWSLMSPDVGLVVWTGGV